MKNAWIPALAVCLVWSTLGQGQQPPAPAKEAETPPKEGTAAPAGLPPIVGYGWPEEPIPGGNLPLGAELYIETSKTHDSEVPEKQASCWWLTGEFLLWFVPDAPLGLPLVTTRPTNIGINNAVQLSPNTLHYQDLNGGRLDGGVWLTPEHSYAVEAGFFVTELRRNALTIASTVSGFPDLDRPLINVLPGQYVTVPISIPNQLIGQLTTTSTVRLNGADLNGLCDLYHESWLHLEALAGVRYVYLQEHLELEQESRGLTGASFTTGAFGTVSDGPTFVLRDAFETTNQFYGTQLGFRGEVACDSAFLRLVGKMAVGFTHEELRTTGNSTYLPGPPAADGGGTPTLLTVAGAGAQIVPGGVLVPATNIGGVSDNRFAILSELDLTAGVELYHHVRLTCGYSLWYWSNVLRPGNQLSNTVNLTEVPISAFYTTSTGLGHSPVPLRTSDYFVNGFHFGVELEY